MWIFSVVRLQRQRRLRNHVFSNVRRRSRPTQEQEEAAKGATPHEPPQQRGRQKGNLNIKQFIRSVR